MRKLDRTLRDMKRESLWDPPSEPTGRFLLDPPGPPSPFSSDRQQVLSGPAMMGRPSSLLRQELRKDWDTNWGPGFGTDFISHFMEGDAMARGAQTGSSPSAPTFSYSQKNFHSADGNLYSIFTPFQARKSTSKPSFFRGPTTIVGETKKSASVGNNLSYEVPSITAEGSPLQSGGSTRSSRSRRGKLKFHNQDVPPQYRTNTATSEGPSATSEAGSSSTDHSHTSSSRINMSSSSFSSSYAKSHSHFSESTKESFFGRSTSMDDTDPFDNFFHRRSSKREDPFEVLDLSKPRSDLFEKDWNRFDELHSAHRLRKSRMRRSIFEDSDHEDEDEPLNLCIADNVMKKQRKKEVSQKVKREPVDSDSDITPAQSPFSAARERFERKHRNLFANRSPGPSIFRSPSPDIPRAAGSTSSENRESAFDFMEDDAALDLSYKQNQRSEFKSHFHERSSFSDESTFSRKSAEETSSKAKTGKVKKVPIISELLESMSIWDECTRSPQPPEPQCSDDAPSAKLDDHKKQRHPKSTNTTAFPSWGVKERNMDDHGQTTQTCKESSGTSKTSAQTKPAAASDSLPPAVEPVTCEINSCRKQSAKLPESNEQLPNPNYYLFVPTTFVPTYGLNPVFVSSQQLPTPTNTAEPCKTEKLTIHIPCMKSKSSDQLPETPRAAEFVSTARIEVKPKIPKVTVGTCFSPKPSRASGTRQPKRQALDSAQARSSSEPPTANDISICKFKLIKGDQPMLEEKKSYFVPLPRANRPTATEVQRSASASSAISASASTSSAGPSTGAAPKPERFRTYKIHVGSQEELGRKLAAGKKTRRRSRKALVREKLEATFREQGFLIKTQQVASAEGAVYCKFRQLKKFTRYLFKSWRDYLPKDLEDMQSSSSLNALLDPNLHHLTKATLSLPDIPSTSMYSPATSRSSSMSGTSGLGTSILTDSGTADTAPFTTDAGSVASLSTNDDGSMMTDATNMSDTYTYPGASPCPSTSSQPCASPSSSSIT